VTIVPTNGRRSALPRISSVEFAQRGIILSSLGRVRAVMKAVQEGSVKRYGISVHLDNMWTRGTANACRVHALLSRACFSSSIIVNSGFWRTIKGPSKFTLNFTPLPSPFSLLLNLSAPYTHVVTNDLQGWPSRSGAVASSCQQTHSIDPSLSHRRE